MKDRQRARGSNRLAAAKNNRSATVIAGTARLAPQDRQFVPQHDDFELRELLRPNAQGNQLE